MCIRDSSNTDSSAQFDDAQEAKATLQSRKWKDNGTIPLQSHVALHRSQHKEIKLRAKGSEQVVIMNEYERCYIFLKSIVASDKNFILHVTTATHDLEEAKNDADFETMVLSLIRRDPVASKITTSATGTKFDISSTSIDDPESTTFELKYYPSDEYKAAIAKYGVPFKQAMWKWRNTPAGKQAFAQQKAAVFKPGGNKRANASSTGMSKSQKKKMRKIQKENDELKAVESAKAMFAKCDSTYGGFSKDMTAEQRFAELSPIFQRSLSKTQKQG